MLTTTPNPLVSIIVITYNSSKYILETLESAKSQVYQNIELIVSDDCSKDDTIEICNNWINANKERFVRTEIVSVKKNTGIASNCNRGINVAQGEWIKLIAGDDTFYKDAIQNYIEFASTNNNISVIHAIAHKFNETFDSDNFINEINYLNSGIVCDDASKQYKILLRKCFVAALTSFIKRSVLLECGGFDEEIPNLEDWPMWLKITKAGHPLYFLEKPTARYRYYDNSVYNRGISSTYIKNFTIDKCRVFHRILKRDLTSQEVFIWWIFCFSSKVIKNLFNRRNTFNRVIYFIYHRLVVNTLEKVTIKEYQKIIHNDA